MDIHSLISAAQKAMANAYAPYSGFKVGAAILCDGGAVYTGCNVEGASFGNAICAERVALVKAVSDGQRKFSALAVIAETDGFCTPCGICRQMLFEFGGGLQVYCCNKNGEYMALPLSQLLPHSFSGETLSREDGK